MDALQWRAKFRGKKAFLQTARSDPWVWVWCLGVRTSRLQGEEFRLYALNAAWGRAWVRRLSGCRVWAKLGFMVHLWGPRAESLEFSGLRFGLQLYTLSVFWGSGLRNYLKGQAT